MQLLSLKYKNLFSLGEGEIDLNNRGLTLITGWSEDTNSANAAGKSSIANKSILWTLFGLTAGGLKTDSVINRHTAKKCWGEVSFISTFGNDNCAKYTIRRERPAKLSLFKDDKDISASTAKETQEFIDKALGINFRTFLQSSVFGQGKNIHYPSLSPREQKEILEQILPMEEIDNWAQYADQQVKILKSKVDEQFQGLNRVSERLVALEEQLKKCEEDKIRFEENRQQSINDAKIALKNVQKQFEPELEQLNKAKEKIKEINIEEAKGKISNLQLAIEKTKALKEEARNSWEVAKKSDSQWVTKLILLKEQKKEIDTSTKCPTCLRDYDDNTLKIIEIKVQEQTRKIEEATENLNQCKTAIDYYFQEMNKYDGMINEANSYIEIIQEQLSAKDKYNQEKQLLESKMETAKASAKSLLFAAENSENPLNSVFLRIQQDLAEARKNKKEINKKYEYLKEELGHLLYWKDIYGKELKLKLFEDTCPFLDARTEYHLGQLKNSQLHCEFSTVKRLASGEAREEFNVLVWSETGGRGFESLSGGEQQIVNFAIGLSLADLASLVSDNKSNFLIMDEPLTELDAKNSEAVVDYLMSEVKNGKDTIFLISNEESLKGLIHNRIHVIKSHGITNVVSE